MKGLFYIAVGLEFFIPPVLLLINPTTGFGILFAIGVYIMLHMLMLVSTVGYWATED